MKYKTEDEVNGRIVELVELVNFQRQHIATIMDALLEYQKFHKTEILDHSNKMKIALDRLVRRIK